MLVLLPPSEGKAAAGSGPALDLAALSYPELSDARDQVLDALVELCGDGDRAAAVLGLGPTQAGEVATNLLVRQAPTLPAGELFTGVLYDHLDLASLSAAARRRAGETFVVLSGLFGALRLGDPLPPHRLAMGVRLPGLGGLAAYWRRSLTAVLTEAAGDGLVVDLRSTPYVNAWKPPVAATVTVRVVTSAGTTVSHFNKAGKGLFARALASSRRTPRKPRDLLDIAESAGLKARLSAGAPWVLDLTVAGT